MLGNAITVCKDMLEFSGIFGHSRITNRNVLGKHATIFPNISCNRAQTPPIDPKHPPKNILVGRPDPDVCKEEKQGHLKKAEISMSKTPILRERLSY